MLSRPRSLVLATLIALVCLPSTGAALEKTSARYPGDTREDWSRATTSCDVVYYNICTGWIWVWSAWDPTDTFGVTFSPCCPGGFGAHLLTETSMFFHDAPPSGYGFTGTLDVWTANAEGCPSGAPLRTTPFLPTSSWNTVSFAGSPVDVSGGDFVVTMTTGPGLIGNPTAIDSDHPSAGPTGPAACGLCYPTTRATRSFYYGPAASPLCPGEPLTDLGCNAEFLWDVRVQCATPVEQRSWGRIKELYR